MDVLDWQQFNRIGYGIHYNWLQATTELITGNNSTETSVQVTKKSNVNLSEELPLYSRKRVNSTKDSEA